MNKRFLDYVLFLIIPLQTMQLSSMNCDQSLMQHLDAKLIETSKLFEYNDAIMKTMASYKMPIIQNSSDDEDKCNIYFRNAFSRRVFGHDIERVRKEKLAKELADKEAKEKKVDEKAKKEKIEKQRAAQKKVAKEKEIKLAAKKANDNFSIDEVLLETGAVQIKNQQFEEAAQTYWKVLQGSNSKEIKVEARKQIQSLHDLKKSTDATYYSVLLVNDPKEKINLFLHAEKERDLKKEQEKSKSLQKKQTALLQKIIDTSDANIITATSHAMAEAQIEIRKLAEKGNLYAYHALIVNNVNQAMVFPKLKIIALRTAEAYAKQLHDSKKSFSGSYDYGAILNDLGVSLYEKVKQKFESKNNAYVNSPILRKKNIQDINDAENYLERSCELGHVESIGNLAKVLELQFKEFKEMNKLDKAVDLYIDALENKSPDAALHVESLLVEGIDNYPLPFFQRNLLMSALKKHKPDSTLLSQKNFNESAYHAAAKKDRSKGSMSFYQGLYWHDKDDKEGSFESVSFMNNAYHEKYSPASLFKEDAMLIGKVLAGKNQEALEKIESAWKRMLSLEFPYRPLLLSSTIIALELLIANNDINASDMIDVMQTYLLGIVYNFVPKDDESIKTVCELLDKSELLLTQNPNHSAQNKLYKDMFINNLLSFSMLFQNAEPLYRVAGHAVTHLQQSSNNEQTIGPIKLLNAITQDLNNNLNNSRYNPPPSEKPKTKLIEKVDQLIAKSQEKEYLANLKSLQSVLQGIPQKIEEKEDILSGNVQEISEKFATFYLEQTTRALSAISVKNDTEIITAWRSLIEKFRKANMQQNYQSLRNEIDIITPLAEYTKKKLGECTTKTDGNDLNSLMQFYLILIADQLLMKENFNFEEALEKFSSKFPILGSASIARELLSDSLFAFNKDKACEYLNRSRANVENIRINPQGK